jgi:hypothetical protein
LVVNEVDMKLCHPTRVSLFLLFTLPFIALSASAQENDRLCATSFFEAGRAESSRFPATAQVAAPEFPPINAPFELSELHLLLKEEHAPPPPGLSLGKRQSEEARAREVQEFFQKLNAGNKRKVALTLRNHTILTGQVTSISANEFTIREEWTKKVSTLPFSDVEEWRIVPSPSDRALSFGRGIGLVLLMLPLLPFMILGGLAGWDGC